MSIERAREISEVLGGEVFEADEGGWLVLLERPDARVVIVSDTSVEEYADRDAYAAGRCYACISLA